MTKGTENNLIRWADDFNLNGESLKVIFRFDVRKLRVINEANERMLQKTLDMCILYKYMSCIFSSAKTNLIFTENLHK